MPIHVRPALLILVNGLWLVCPVFGAHSGAARSIHQPQTTLSLQLANKAALSTPAAHTEKVVLW
jgi:hypothetical protein